MTDLHAGQLCPEARGHGPSKILPTMALLILRRLLQLPLILGVVLALTLVLAWLIPGNPLDRPEGRRPQPEVVRAMQAQYNLDSFWTFAGSYVYAASGARYAFESLSPTAQARRAAWAESGRAPPPRAVFDLGPSLQYRDQRVSEIIADALPVSMTLGAAAILLAVLIGVTAGVVGAARPGTMRDHAALGMALVGVSVPSFVVGSLLALVFCVYLRVLPFSGTGLLASILPVVTLALPPAAYIARLTRVGMAEVMGGVGADYIRTARAKGLSERRVLLHHALKNAFLPVLSYLGPAAAVTMTGSFVVEKVFSVPGMGQHFVNAVLNKDLFLLLGVVLVYATLLILFNLVVDVLYRWVDPRISA